jgi:hypothetical protein
LYQQAQKTEGGETTAAFKPCPFFYLDPSLLAFSED